MMPLLLPVGAVGVSEAVPTPADIDGTAVETREVERLESANRVTAVPLVSPAAVALATLALTVKICPPVTRVDDGTPLSDAFCSTVTVAVGGTACRVPAAFLTLSV